MLFVQHAFSCLRDLYRVCLGIPVKDFSPVPVYYVYKFHYSGLNSEASQLSLSGIQDTLLDTQQKKSEFKEKHRS